MVMDMNKEDDDEDGDILVNSCPAYVKMFNQTVKRWELLAAKADKPQRLGKRGGLVVDKHLIGETVKVWIAHDPWSGGNWSTKYGRVDTGFLCGEGYGPMTEERHAEWIASAAKDKPWYEARVVRIDKNGDPMVEEGAKREEGKAVEKKEDTEQEKREEGKRAEKKGDLLPGRLMYKRGSELLLKELMEVMPDVPKSGGWELRMWSEKFLESANTQLRPKAGQK
eukprot:gene21533-32988_t